MPMFSIDENCVKCGLCADLCPAGIIKTDESKAPFVAGEVEGRCIRCGQCVSFCPVRACYLDFQPVGDRVVVDAGLMPSAESAETLLRSRRSVRRFKDEPLPRALIEGLLDTARYAPTASNSQEVRWVVSETREKTKAIAGRVIEFFRETAAAIAVGDEGARPYSGIVGVWDGGYDIITRGAPNLALAVMPSENRFHADGAIALTYLELAAHANGVGCCWAGFVTMAARNNRELCRSVGVRDDETIVGGQMMGFPAPAVAISKLLPPRKPIDVSWM